MRRLIKDKRVVRVVALSGGYTRDDACERLAKNHGMIASFSRALAEGLRRSMSDAEFDEELATPSTRSMRPRRSRSDRFVRPLLLWVRPAYAWRVWLALWLDRMQTLPIVEWPATGMNRFADRARRADC